MDTVSYQCPSCGAPLGWDAVSGGWKCEFCLSEFTKAELEGVHRADSEAAGGETVTGPGTDPERLSVSVCPQCGAELVADETTAASFCVFCGNTAILKQQLEGKFAPSRVIPFAVEKEASQDAFRRLCRKRIFTPRTFLSEQHIEKLTGIYLPFWLCSCDMDCHTAGNAQRVRTWSDSRFRYIETSVYRIIRSGHMYFDGVPADGSSKMDNALMDSIEPYDYGAMQPFSLPYLSGYFAERYDEDAEAVFPRIAQRMETTAQEILSGTVVGYTGYQIDQRQFDMRSRKSEYVLLPVWMVNSRYKGKDYVFAMNGQTGKMAGTLPVSIPRMLAFFGGLTAAVYLLLLLGGMLF